MGTKLIVRGTKCVLLKNLKIKRSLYVKGNLIGNRGFQLFETTFLVILFRRS